MAINTSILKSYAPQARRDFIVAVKMRAARFGIVDGSAAVIQEKGDVAIINGEAYPRAVARQCRDLEGKIALRGFNAVMEEVAYTWFNRFAAIRYMELHGYLDHGFRVLSHPGGETTPELVQHADRVSLPGLKADRIVDLKLDGRKDEELYRVLLVAQCNALHSAMPFLFERINDETELLLPDNLLHSDSVIRDLVQRIPEADWQEIEIIGWLYQFYISEKKDQVIGKVVKSEDIPAATQLFTPNWIVKYMVQNSLGAKWLATYPDSPLKAKMEYYIEPAEQPEDVQRQIEAETPKTLDPETLTFLDPACGSGHILVEAYDLLKDIYLERGYRLREIPRLILEKNVYGLDIDDRAAQLSGFALVMRARADDRRILSDVEPVRLNVIAIQESTGIDLGQLAAALSPEKKRFDLVTTNDLLPHTVAQPVLGVVESASVETGAILELIDLFGNAKTLGSLISVPPSFLNALARMEATLSHGGNDLLDGGSRTYVRDTMMPLVRQAELLGRKYDVVAANPPYMGSKGMNVDLKRFAQASFPESRSDLFAMFMEQAIRMTKPAGLVAMINMHAWMYLSSYQALRTKILSNATILNMAHLGERAFDTIGGAVVSTTAFVLWNVPHGKQVGKFIKLVNGSSEAEKAKMARDAIRAASSNLVYLACSEDFLSLPASPLAYSASAAMKSAFKNHPPLSAVAEKRLGLCTGDNERFIRYWFEVDFSEIGFEHGTTNDFLQSGSKYAPHNKGGETIRWFGNQDLVIKFDKENFDLLAQSCNKLASRSRYFQPCVTWSEIGSVFAARVLPKGYVFNIKGPSIFKKETDLAVVLAACNSTPFSRLLSLISSTISFNGGEVEKIPVPLSEDLRIRATEIARDATYISKLSYNDQEFTWGFQGSVLLATGTGSSSLEEKYREVRREWDERTLTLRHLEEQNNGLFIQAYGLESEIQANVQTADVTLYHNPEFRYGKGKSSAALEVLLLGDTMVDLISYAVGCMVGRYSHERPGTIIADQGATLEDYLERVPNPTFMPDADNIIPMLDDNWFEDDVTDRFLEFLKVTFGTEHFNDNLAFIESAIGKDIRKFFKRDFFSDHLKRYKRRPIYWVFSSGKEKAFEAIVYMHRYNEGTLARMRMNYVVPLQSQMASRIERLAAEANGADLSSAERKRKDTQRAKLIKQLEELGRFEEELRHLADQRIRIDLDDGVKVNYAKFGNLLAETKAVVGKDDD